MKIGQFFEEYKSFIQSFSHGASRFLKYQITTKLLISVLILPLFATLIQALVYSSGRPAVSNNEMGQFLFSPHGILFLAIGAFVLVLSVLIELGGLVLLSAQILHNKPESSYKDLMKSNFKLLPKMFEIGSFILLLYLIFLVPLSKIGVTLSFLGGIRIPSFVNIFVEEHFSYKVLYYLLLFVLLCISIRWIFLFQFMMIEQNRPSQALKNSSLLFKKNYKEFFCHLAMVVIINLSLLFVFSWLWNKGLSFFVWNLTGDSTRWLLLVLLFVKNILLSLTALLLIPFELHFLTNLFYHFVSKTEPFCHQLHSCPEIPEKSKLSPMDKVFCRKKSICIGVLSAIVIISIPLGFFYEEIFVKENSALVIAHRGGGGHSIPENSLSAFESAIKNRADYIELDVQRTKDGAYIIHHDSDFERLAGVSKASFEMTLDEIKALDIGKKFPNYPNERICTLAETLDLCQNKIGLFIELKGETADKQMADDIALMLTHKETDKEIVLVSSNSTLLEYIQKNYPELKTGFVYYFALGKAGNFSADYIIIEESAATDNALKSIHQAEKQSVVWTINRPKSMRRLIQKNVDAIITDDVQTLRTTIEEFEKQDYHNRLLDKIISIAN
ncbi:MAG: glycerophosphoryl diester phosphodiesterase membrane domain-containing protein [Peptostreptococcaceae bacterium]|nr:glycerophosphoryl diester phosphodiesterase membrane domain-containing protein [Peptostreptococcaceae bacterium]